MSCYQLETSPIYMLLMGMEKEGKMIIAGMGKEIEGNRWRGPCLWSVPRKQDNAPQHLVWGRQDPGLPQELTMEKAMGVKGKAGTQGAWLTKVVCHFCGFSGYGQVSALLWPGPF